MFLCFPVLLCKIRIHPRKFRRAAKMNTGANPVVRAHLSIRKIIRHVRSQRIILSKKIKNFII